MIINISRSYILHTEKRGETSLYISLFTQERGIIKALYKGARKNKIVLQPFTPFWANIKRLQSRDYIQHIEPLGKPCIFKNISLFAALYINELLYTLLLGEEPCSALFAAYEDTICKLYDALDKFALEKALRYFELKLLNALGLDIRGNCIKDDKHYNFVPGDGFILTSKKAILGKHIRALLTENLTNETLNIAKQIMRKAIAFALDGKPIKARLLFGVKNE